MKNIGVFCAASSCLDAAYYEEARAFGEWMGAHNMTLVYGGADSGLMESVAKGIKQKGGTVMGVVPRILETRRKISNFVDRVIPCNDLSERKNIILEQCDIMVALPGGIGTLDEIFTAMASNSIGYHPKKVILFNLSGFWDKLLGVLYDMDEKHFINTPLDQYLAVARTWDDIERLLL